MTRRTTLPTDGIDEATWQKQVIDLAHLFSWTVAHFRPAQTTKGWRTAVAADGAGFPDLVLARDRIVFAELKRDGGKLSDAQRAWGLALRYAGAETYVWCPADLDEVGRVLARREERAA